MNANDTPDGRLQLASQKNDVAGIRRELANGALLPLLPTQLPARDSRALLGWCRGGRELHRSRVHLDGASHRVARRQGRCCRGELCFAPPTHRPHPHLPAPECSRLTHERRGAQALLQAGASPDIANDGGNTAMHMASRNGQVRCVELLCQAGGSLEIANEEGKLARQEAAERVTRKFRYNGTSHQGVLEAIDREAAARQAGHLCAALQRLAFTAAMQERLGAGSALRVQPLPRRAADGCWELLVRAPHTRLRLLLATS